MTILLLLPIAAAGFLIAYGAGSGRLWLVVPALVLGIGGCVASFRLYVRAMNRQRALDSALIAALEQRARGPGSSQVFNRNAPIAWPLFITAIFIVFAAFAWSLQDPVLKLFTLIFLLPAAAIGWLVARRRRGLLLELSATGLRIAGHEIPWRQIRNVRMVTHYREPAPHLHIDLVEPLPAHGWMRRTISFLSRGAADREVAVSLRHAAEPAAVIFEVTREYWGDIVGNDIPFAARGREIAQYQRELRTFSDRTAEEKRLLITVILAGFGFMAWYWQGSRASFWSSPEWWGLSWWSSAAFTAIGLIRLLRHRGLASLRNQQGPAMYLVMFLFVFGMMTCANWLIIGRSLPDIATRLTGSRHETILELRKTVKPAARSCALRISGQEMQRRFPSAYCADAGEFARLPESGPMRVISRDSWFGRHIDRIEPVDPARAP